MNVATMDNDLQQQHLQRTRYHTSRSPLELLLTELFDMVLSCLSLHELSILYRCSKTLQRRIEPTLYHGDGLGDSLAVRLSRNENALVKAARHGGFATLGCCDTLLRLLEKGQLRVFECLWKRGHWSPKPLNDTTVNRRCDFGPHPNYSARLRMHRADSQPCYPHTAWRMLEIASLPAARSVLQVILEHPGKTTHLEGMHVADILLSKVLARRDTTVDLLWYILDHGADPYRVQGTDHSSPDPLVMALFRDLDDGTEMFDLLVQRGASIHGKRFNSGPDSPNHIPIFAATYRMAKMGVRRSRVLQCLEAGAMIDHTAQILSRHRVRVCKLTGMDRHGKKHYIASPVYAFLDSITDWTLRPRGGGVGPIEGVEFWLEHGLVIGKDGIPKSAGLARTEIDGVKLRPLVIFVVEKFGIGKLVDDDFFEVMRYLAGFGAARHQVLDVRGELHAGYMEASKDARERWNIVLGMFGCAYPVWAEILGSRVVLDDDDLILQESVV